MASYHHLLQHTKHRHESPAKVFAKLKSKVQREAMCAQDRASNVHGAEINSPRKRAESHWMADDLTENHRFDSYRRDVQALTLSPISTPRKNFAYSFSDVSRQQPVGELLPVTEMGDAFVSRNACSPTKRAFLESTAVSHPLPLATREQIYREPHQIRDFDGFKVTGGTPVKLQPMGNDRVRGVFEEDRAPLDKLMSPAELCSPSKNRMRKRKWEQQEFNKVSNSTREVNHVASPHQVRKTSTAFSEDDTHNKADVEDLGDIRRFPVDQPEMGQLTHGPMFPPPRSTVEKRCFVILQKCPPMSPAKMFAYMKERENKRKQQEVPEVSSSTRELSEAGNNLHKSSDIPLSMPPNMGEMEDTAFTSNPESAAPVSHSGVESADSQLDPSEDVLDPAAVPQPVLLEDPLVLNSPQICIPKKQQAVFKHNKWPHRTKFPNESVIYLKNWFLRKNNKGLFVDGIHSEDNVPWNSNIILERVSSSVLKTITGRVYILVGKMNLDTASVFPNWLLKKFVNGFPSNWKMLYEKFLSESRDRGTERTSEARAVKATTKPEAHSTKLSLKQHRQKTFKTPDSCPPTTSKVSRSGRVIKPPLEYWKGGRVILDAQMNVTIHECYDTSICIPEVTTTVSARKSQKPARVFLPCSEGRKQCDSASSEEPVPLRRVKVPVRKHNLAKVNHDEKPSNAPESPVETISSPEEWSGTAIRSSTRCPTVARMVYVDTVPQKHKEPEKASNRRSKKHQKTHDTNRFSERVRKRTVTASSESPTDTDKTTQQESSDEEFPGKRKKKGKGVQRKKDGNVSNKSRPSRVSSSSQSPDSTEERKKDGKVSNKSRPRRVSSSNQSPDSTEETRKELRKRTRETKNSKVAQTRKKHTQSKCTKMSPPTKPLPKSKSSMTHKSGRITAQEQDEDKWTEAELMKLQEAVAYYPKHMAGYWAKVASMVGTRSAEECHNQHTSQGTSQSPVKKAKIPSKEKAEAPKGQVTDQPLISARVGTLKRKQQVRQFLEAMPRDNVDDVFSSAYMQSKRFEMPSMCPSDDHDFAMSDLEPLTPISKVFPEVKTPQCLHITPGMMGSPNRNNDDKYVFQLQKRMKKNQFNVCKQPHSSKSFSPTPSVKRTMRRCGNTENDTFVVWEMFPGKDVAISESEEEEDFYFSDNE